MVHTRKRAWLVGFGGLAGVAIVATSVGIVGARGPEPERSERAERPAQAAQPHRPNQPTRPAQNADLPSAAEVDYEATVQVVEDRTNDRRDDGSVDGVVFHDRNMDGKRQRHSESGIRGIMVSNGREVVKTDKDGEYELPAYDDMSVMVTKPSTWAVPTDDDNIPQMAYQHKPAGSPGEFRYGGLDPTGPLPAAINFPMVPVRPTNDFTCAVMGDTQPYSNNEVGFVRDSIAAELLEQDLTDAECMMLLGDVVGDDLSLLPRFKDMMSTVGLPQYYIHGNHDYDFDATSDADSSDTWRREYGPAYYSYDIGQVHFVVLDDVVYPCTAEEDKPENCGDPTAPVYNGRITDTQMEWLENDLANVPQHKLVVLNHHIPMLSFVDNEEVTHQLDNLADVYELLEGRKSLSLSGHTHTLEQILPGDSYAGFDDAIGVEEAEIHHIVAGAPSGSWYSGDLDWEGIPISLGRLGEPRGYFMFEFNGTNYEETYHATGHPKERQMWLSFNTPQYRQWFNTLRPWTTDNFNTPDGIPPVNVNDLADLKLFTPKDLKQGVYLTANVWNGSTDSDVSVSIDGGEPTTLEHTQQGEGEEAHYGVDYSDPYAVVRQLQTARYAFESTSGNERAQGYETSRGGRFGPGAPQSVSESYIAEKSSHLWRLEVPKDLAIGSHVAEVTHTDRYGRESIDRIVFEVREERPFPFWNEEPWEEETNAHGRRVEYMDPSSLDALR